MSFEDYATYQEITTQTRAWSQAIEVTRSITLPGRNDYKSVIFTGCGSTYYLAIAIASLYQSLTGIHSRAVPGSELLFNPQSFLSKDPDGKPKKTLLVAISRSGTTTETIKAVDQFKRTVQGEVVVISNYDQTLSTFADVNIVIPKGQEISVAQTRSFSSMYVAGTIFCMRMASRDDLRIQFQGYQKLEQNSFVNIMT